MCILQLFAINDFYFIDFCVLRQNLIYPLCISLSNLSVILPFRTSLYLNCQLISHH